MPEPGGSGVFVLALLPRWRAGHFCFTDTLPHVTLGEAYTAQLRASGGTPPYTWHIASGALPPGLTLHATGIISGIPTVAGNYHFTAEVKNAGRIAPATRTFAPIHFIGARTPDVRAAPGT